MNNKEIDKIHKSINEIFKNKEPPEHLKKDIRAVLFKILLKEGRINEA